MSQGEHPHMVKPCNPFPISFAFAPSWSTSATEFSFLGYFKTSALQRSVLQFHLYENTIMKELQVFPPQGIRSLEIWYLHRCPRLRKKKKRKSRRNITRKKKRAKSCPYTIFLNLSINPRYPSSRDSSKNLCHNLSVSNEYG